MQYRPNLGLSLRGLEREPVDEEEKEAVKYAVPPLAEINPIGRLEPLDPCSFNGKFLQGLAAPSAKGPGPKLGR